MKIYPLFFLLFYSCISIAQQQKGDWLVRGSGSSLNTTRVNSSVNDISLNLALGYFINDQWMAGSGIGLSLSRNTSFIRNDLFARYYFKDTLKNNRFYLEARWELGKFAPVGVGQSSRRFTNRSGIIGIGVDHFISKHLAIEAKLDYYFLTIFKQFGDDRVFKSDLLSFNVGFQYFFRYRDYQKERMLDYRTALQAGTWFVGGTFVLNEPSDTRNSVTTIQNIKPHFGRFIFQNWAVGSAFSYDAGRLYRTINVEFAPFSRYYINIGRKKKIFVEANASYQIELIQDASSDFSRRNFASYGGAIGWSNFINKDVSFDIAYSFLKTISLKNEELINGDLLQRGGIVFSIQYFISSKK